MFTLSALLALGWKDHKTSDSLEQFAEKSKTEILETSLKCFQFFYWGLDPRKG